MVTLQEQFEKDFPNKNVGVIDITNKYLNSDFTNYDLDLRQYWRLVFFKCCNNKITSLDISWSVDLTELDCSFNNLASLRINNCSNLTMLDCSFNNLTSASFLNALPNPEKLKELLIFSNNIQPTDISIFSRFVNLKALKIGNVNGWGEKYNRFYGSLKAYQPLTKLSEICIEATDVGEGLEYLPMSLAEATRGGGEKVSKIGGVLECHPRNAQAKCKKIQDRLRKFDYDLEAWQLAHPQKIYISYPEYFQQPETRDKWYNAVLTKIEKTQERLEEIKTQQPDKVKKIKRLESKIRELGLIKTLIEERSIFEDSLEGGVRWYNRLKEDKSTQTETKTQDQQIQTEELTKYKMPGSWPKK